MPLARTRTYHIRIAESNRVCTEAQPGRTLNDRMARNVQAHYGVPGFVHADLPSFLSARSAPKGGGTYLLSAEDDQAPRDVGKHGAARHDRSEEDATAQGSGV